MSTAYLYLNNLLSSFNNQSTTPDVAEVMPVPNVTMSQSEAFLKDIYTAGDDETLSNLRRRRRQKVSHHPPHPLMITNF